MNGKIYSYIIAILIAALSFSGCEEAATKEKAADLPATSIDTTSPVITLEKGTNYNLLKDTPFIDPGYSANDEKDGVVAVRVNGEVNSSKEGSYVLTYSASDKAGNEATTKRTVVVYIPNKMLFLNDPSYGREVWVTDGTVAGTLLPKDIKTTPSNSYVGYVTKVGNTIYFSARHMGDTELWKSDGTVSGTQRVKDINPHGSSSPKDLKTYQGKVLFTADDGIHGYEPWVSDGTEAGTYRLDSGMNASYYASNHVYNGISYYVEKDNENSNKNDVWASDGTPAGTYNLTKTDYTLYSGVYTLNSKVYFATGYFLVQTQGTPATTKKVDFGNVSPSYIMNIYKDKIYFKSRSGRGKIYRVGESLNDFEAFVDVNGTQVDHGYNGKGFVIDDTHYIFGKKIWRSKGTTATTTVIKELEVSSPVQLGDKVVFIADDAIHGKEYWVSDGTTAGTKLLKDINPNGDIGWFFNCKNINDICIFPADDKVHGKELWATDGTPEGTNMLADFNPGVAGSSQISYKSVNGTIVIQVKAYWGAPYRYWRSDGTPQNTVAIDDDDPLVKGYWGAISFDSDTLIFRGPYNTPEEGALVSFNINTREKTVLTQNPQTRDLTAYSTDNHDIVQIDNISFYGTNYRSDGTPEGTYPVANTNEIRKITRYKNKLYFIDWSKNESYFSVMDLNGTNAQHIMEVYSPPYASDSTLVKSNDKLYFVKRVNGTRLWVSDGTLEGSHQLEGAMDEDFYHIKEVMPAENLVYFVARTAAYGYEFWVTDGTKAGTHMIKDIKPGSDSPMVFNTYYNHVHFLIKDNKLYFFADDGEHGFEPWVSDGTEGGTFMLRDANIFNKHVFNPMFIATDEHVYFNASNDDVWVTDGTTLGTQKLLDAIPYYGSNVLVIGHSKRIALSNKLYILHDDNVHGRELWVSDGTVMGTHMIKDIDESNTSSVPSWEYDDLYVYNDSVYFKADDGVHGMSLWKSDGTTVGTQLFLDAAEGAYELDYSFPGLVGDKMLINATYPTQLYITDGTKSGTKLLIER